MKNNTLKYFYEIMQIPRQSGNEKHIVNYLKNFAKTNKLQYLTDENNNIIIYKNKNAKNKIILQSHTDMVCVSNNNFDFNNGLIKKIDGDFLSSVGTSLGADNGIGVALILSILQEDLSVGIEAVLTSEEETTMNGAKTLDCSNLQSKNLLSFDGDRDNVIEISSAGFVILNFEFDNLEQDFGYSYKFSISNLPGGHSGVDIDKNIDNAILLAFKFIKENNLKLVNMYCDNKDNVIPSSCTFECLSKTILNKNLKIQSNHDIKFEYNFMGEKSANVICNLVEFVNKLPSGVLSRYEDNFVQTSLNIASINTDNMNLCASLRSSNIQNQTMHLEQIKSLSQKHNILFKTTHSSPFFESNSNCEMISKLAKSYKKLFGDDPKIARVHAGLEGGVFAEKIKDINIAVIGANIYDMHSVTERVSIKSVDKVYNWTYDFLSSYDK